MSSRDEGATLGEPEWLLSCPPLSCRVISGACIHMECGGQEEGGGCAINEFLGRLGGGSWRT